MMTKIMDNESNEISLMEATSLLESSQRLPYYQLEILINQLLVLSFAGKSFIMSPNTFKVEMLMILT